MLSQSSCQTNRQTLKSTEQTQPIKQEWALKTDSWKKQFTVHTLKREPEDFKSSQSILIWYSSLKKWLWKREATRFNFFKETIFREVRNSITFKRCMKLAESSWIVSQEWESCLISAKILSLKIRFPAFSKSHSILLRLSFEAGLMRILMYLVKPLLTMLSKSSN